MADEKVKEQDAQEQKPEVKEPETKPEAEPAEAAEPEPAPKGHDFDKGLSKVQRKFNDFQRETQATLKRIMDKLESQPSSATESKAAEQIVDFMAGRDPNDVPSIGDFQKLMQEVSKLGRGPDANSIKEAVSELIAPLMADKKKAEDEAQWAKFFQAHPTIDQDAVNELWAEATEMAEEDGGSDVAIEAATKAHFKHLVKSKERSLKRSPTTASTKSPTSPDGTQTIKPGASTTAQPPGKRGLDDLYRGLATNRDKWFE